MKERWLKTNFNLPQVDKEDINNEHPLFNGGNRVKPRH
jgi:hypothetical protein